MSLIIAPMAAAVLSSSAIMFTPLITRNNENTVFDTSNRLQVYIGETDRNFSWENGICWDQSLICREIELSVETQFDNLQKIREFSQLEEGWDGYDAPRIPEQVLECMRTLVVSLKVQPEIFPTARESIQFEYDKSDGSHIEFEVFENGDISLLSIDARGGINNRTIRFDVEQINEVVSEFYAR